VSHGWSWSALLLLGAFHGLNPAMGWLFAVALGLQERRRGAVLGALPPIALGHALSVALVLLALLALDLAAPPAAVRAAGAAALVGLGAFKLARPLAHPRWVGMRVGARDLALWSFLMSTAHGAGLMLVPALLALPRRDPALAAAALGVHTAGLLAAMGAAAVAVYETAGLAILRRAWINLDLVWAAALIAAGVLTLLL
jgi:hypothetical protein